MSWSDWAREATAPQAAREKPEALEGILVLDVSRSSYAGLFCSSLLAEFGARVVRVEPPGGDPARFFSPEGMEVGGTGLAYLVEGRNKEHIVLDLEEERDRATLRALSARADVLVETEPPGSMASRGLGYEDLKALNPGLIYLSLHTFGQEGPLAEVAGRAGWSCSDTVTQAASGFVHTTGLPAEYTEFPEEARVPTRMGNWLAWYAGGVFGALAVMAALLWREESREGQAIDLSPAEALMCLNNYALPYYHISGEVMERPGNVEPAAHPYCYVRCKDGMVFLAGYTDANWKALCEIIGRPDLVDRFPTVSSRTDPAAVVEIVREIEKFTMERTREELVAIWNAYRGPGVTVCGEVLTPMETSRLSHWYERGALLRVTDPTYGELLLPGLPAKMSETPPRLKWVCRPAGADTEFVLLDLLGSPRAGEAPTFPEGAAPAPRGGAAPGREDL